MGEIVKEIGGEAEDDGVAQTNGKDNFKEKFPFPYQLWQAE